MVSMQEIDYTTKKRETYGQEGNTSARRALVQTLTNKLLS